MLANPSQISIRSIQIVYFLGVGLRPPAVRGYKQVRYSSVERWRQAFRYQVNGVKDLTIDCFEGAGNRMLGGRRREEDHAEGH